MRGLESAINTLWLFFSRLTYATSVYNDITSWIRASKVKYELPRLADHMFGTASGVPANLKEFATFDDYGQKREKHVHCIAETLEIDTWIELAFKQQLMDELTIKNFMQRNESVRKQLHGLKKKVDEEKPAPKG